MGSEDTGKISAIVLRIVLFANLIAIMAYGAIEPHEMSKVTAEAVTIGIAGLTMAVQICVTLAVFTPIFYAVWVVIGLDGVCAAGWVAVIAILSYWDREVVYSPRVGDPAAWFKCANARSSDQVWTSSGIGSWIHVMWCEVVMDNRNRLIGNGAARQQLHVLIGLSVTSLFLTLLILLWTIKRGQALGVIKARRQTSAV